ncbi:hypothetical protein OCL06_06820 [Alteromonas sp. ASW11-19]|uniref:Flavodoxin-like domain-containing protein n=1 Tax=Alteromonas salexigens TaxID=2982530 RepID=A0ABT2VPZ0_9ALTE|nr:hypothetical protein [Alteromonas salexigens]MCU7554306.1 hypothetical protein [Alteromonas salexigens]
MTASLAIIYHHDQGVNTDRATSQLVSGIHSQGVETQVFSTVDAVHHVDALDSFDGMAFGAATGNESVISAMQSLAGACYSKSLSGAWRDKLATGFTASSWNSHALNAMLEFSLFSARFNMIWVPALDTDYATSLGASSRDLEHGDFTLANSLNHEASFQQGQRLGQMAKQWKPDY